MPDLFGHPQRAGARTDLERKRARRRATKHRGHAWAPGTGPAGETCGSCKHLCRMRRYAKCGVVRAKWTNSIRTDVRIRDCACKMWLAREAAP